MFSYSTPLNKALAANSQMVSFLEDDDDVLITEPLDSDTFVAGLGNQNRAPQQVMVLPYCDGGPNSEFDLRLYGWWVHGLPKDKNNLLWIRLLLAEFHCIAGSRNGYQTRLIKAGEHFASQINLTAGTVGQYGHVQNGPIAYAKVDLQGCQKYQFACATGAGSGLGNALWAITSSW